MGHVGRIRTGWELGRVRGPSRSGIESVQLPLRACFCRSSWLALRRLVRHGLARTSKRPAISPIARGSVLKRVLMSAALCVEIDYSSGWFGYPAAGIRGIE
ncbi:hypothetical protein MLAC_08260 [Mycobacterium lacus]|uniref:Uncharacterized protein n=1 Tax=Mycobacterium lacus TaxID=169765 RepID=A0A7I7NFT4_9MYCO|nr:hypothetical protein MLAC_08260 [Mycobacterium lacus]